MGNIKKSLKKSVGLVAVVLCVGLLSACSSPESNTYKNAEIDSDPLESLNRTVFEFNHTVDGVFLKPIAEGYDEVMPERGKIMVSNFVDNIKEPVTFANSILQVDAHNTFSTLWRFMLNSTVGIGGLFDVASEVGLKNRETGFGDTLAIYGADAGAYIVLPILGPSSVRDGIGRIGDVVMDPISYTKNSIFYSVVGVKTVDARYNNLKLLDDIYASSIDPYSTIRSGYIQHRAAEVKKAINARNESLKASREQSDK